MPDKHIGYIFNFISLGSLLSIAMIIFAFIFALKIKSDEINHHLLLLNNESHPNLKILKKLNDEKINKVKNNITIDQVREFNNFFPTLSYTLFMTMYSFNI